MLVNFQQILCLFLILNCARCTLLDEIDAAQIVKFVNSIPKHSWKAGLGFTPEKLKNISRLMGVLPLNELSLADFLLKKEWSVSQELLPESYDVTLRWPQCKSVSFIRDQSNCGSCWALSTASVFSDRLCIASNATVNKVLSGEYVNSCSRGNGCEGGYPEMAWRFIMNRGLCTGGEYGSQEGCQPYSISPCARENNSCYEKNEETPKCYRDQCTNPNYGVSLSTDLNHASKIYIVASNERAIMHEIIRNGPVVAAMRIHQDFLYYTEGVYQHTAGCSTGDHAIKIFGWGREDGIKYWLCANTWGSSWGMNGTFKILRGENECGIESRITAGLP